MEALSCTIDNKFNKFLTRQAELEDGFCNLNKKNNGVYLTSNSSIIDSVLLEIPNDESIFSLSYLEPSCGHGAFLIKLILKAYLIFPKKSHIERFIQDRLHFVDIDPEMVRITKVNISELFYFLFNVKYAGTFHSYVTDFTLFSGFLNDDTALSSLQNKIDFVIGNPPYVTLYGRRDKKKNEEQRIYYLNNYSQFPATLKNGKINYVMLFIERGLQFLKKGGSLSFVIDVSFFETAYFHCRKHLIENYTIESLIYNIQSFENVASGQIIIAVKNKKPNDNSVLVIDDEKDSKIYIKQEKWNQPDDEYKFRISHCNKSDQIIEKIFRKSDPTLKELFPKKNLRTCVMLLNMEDKFTSSKPSQKVVSYPYYRGSIGLKYKYSNLNNLKYFNYDKNLQNKINDKLKKELILKGIKNKKRIGLGETVIYDNPKVYIRQSAKELIASFDEKPSSANNSLYVFSLRNNSIESVNFLKYFCGLLNSKIYTFFAQNRRIIRYNKGKQPQIKTSDLYQVFIPQDKEIEVKITELVDKIYKDSNNIEKYKNDIDLILYSYYILTLDEINTIEKSIEDFLQ
ncbi:hypothetical protein MNBD_GAMMA22-2347 [hydrothermal vent metagenome]|uniref:site-specific DNA-methyltransferase (adenine-specific) n=1 Tax=hydrothermal vent metagenome TaxID=652676 RepID=A0A3B0ZK90_9ZZZZ